MPDLNPSSPIRAHITDSFEPDGIGVILSLRYSESIDDIRVIHFDKLGMMSVDKYDPGTVVTPSFRVPNDFARALLDALLRHYQGASDLHQLRQDYMDERSRVDLLVRHVNDVNLRLVDVADRLAGRLLER